MRSSRTPAVTYIVLSNARSTCDVSPMLLLHSVTYPSESMADPPEPGPRFRSDHGASWSDRSRSVECSPANVNVAPTRSGEPAVATALARIVARIADPL